MKERCPYITVTQGMSGYFAVMVWWNPEGFEEPYQTGVGRYKTEKEAKIEAKRKEKSKDDKNQSNLFS